MNRFWVIGDSKKVLFWKKSVFIFLLRDGNPVPRTARNKAYYYSNTSQWFGQKKDEKVDFLC